ncbi:hypothetical protein HanLR1_Chr15g0569241 [Helianthus annuus]|nr:hypothetical protein HanLR1_Chr15g0569241 [Helianthus annuus]
MLMSAFLHWHYRGDKELKLLSKLVSNVLYNLPLFLKYKLVQFSQFI